MSIYKRYFRITSGPLIDAGRAIMQQNRDARAELKAFCNEVGAENVHTYESGDVAGFVFDKQPDGDLWGKQNKHGLRMPRKNTKSGRELKARANTLPKAPTLSTVLETVGLYFGFPALIEGGTGYSSVAFGAPDRGVMFVKVPWRDVDQKELSDYKCQRESENPHHSSISLDHLLWTPTADMVEVKEWEVMREIEALNAAIKLEASA